MPEQGPHCEMMQSDDTVFVSVTGSQTDDLDTVIHAAHNQFKFLADDWTAVSLKDVSVVRPD